jgi:hypothetical protein
MALTFQRGLSFFIADFTRSNYRNHLADSTAQRLDVHNGLLLSTLWDAAFDQGLVSFADNGSVLANAQLSETARRAMDTGSHRTARRAPANLAVHRARNGFDIEGRYSGSTAGSGI